jgi:hypothetical protein
MLHLCADWRVGIDGEADGWLLEEDCEKGGSHVLEDKIDLILFCHIHASEQATLD